MRGLYAIVDVPHPFALDLEACVRGVLACTAGRDGDASRGRGAAAVQLRAKHVDTRTRIAWLERMAPLCLDAGVPLIVNDDVEAALAGIPGVCGVHLGQGDAGFDDVAGIRLRARAQGAKSFIVGLSTHTLAQLRAACLRRPDYVAYGPVFATPSKRDHCAPVGFGGLLEACRLASRPLVAIGGLDAGGAARAVEIGADAVACVSALQRTDEASTRDASIACARAIGDALEPLDLDRVHARVPVLSRELLVDLARWSDDLGMHREMGLPNRFRPSIDDRGEARYRASDVLDLLWGLDKRADETWDGWRQRVRDRGESGRLVQLRSGE